MPTPLHRLRSSILPTSLRTIAAISRCRVRHSRAYRIRECRTLQREIAAIVRSEVGKIELRNRCSGVGIDHDVVAAVRLANDADARKIVPLREDLVGNRLP